jgi:Fe-S-cluster containining protein
VTASDAAERTRLEVNATGPLVQGAEHLHFACNGCGDCCRRHRVALTHRDLSRLGAVVNEPLARLVEWLSPAEVDFEAEADGFVTLPAGPRLMVLAHARAACRFLTSDDRCGVYSARPRDCEVYPFVLERDEQRRPRRLTLFDPEGCGDRAKAPQDLFRLARADDDRWAEVDDYRTLVKRWNRVARHRRRFGYKPGDAAHFIAFLGSKGALDSTT